MSYTSNQVNSQSLNGIISLSDGVLNIEDGVISNIQLLKVVGDSELDGNLIVDGKITCAYTALLGSDVVNKAFVDDAFNTNSRFLKVDGSNKMNSDLNVGNNYIYNLLDPSGNQDATTKNYTDTKDNLRLLKSGDTMSGQIDMTNHTITNLGTPFNPTDACSALVAQGITNLAISALSSVYLPINGTTPMTANLDMGTYMVSNIGIAIPTANQAVAKAHLTSVLGSYLPLLGGIMTGALNMNSYTINNVPILQAGATITLKILTETIMQIQALKVLMSMPIDMGGKLINVMGNGVLSTDAATKGHMDTADLLKMDKLNGVGTGLMILTNTSAALLLSNPTASGNLALESLLDSTISFQNSTTHIPFATIKGSPTSQELAFHNNNSVKTFMINSTSVNCLLPTYITGGLKINTGELDMNNNTITNTSNIHSFGTNPIYLTNAGVAKVKIDASGITMKNSGNIDMAGNNIINMKAPIVLSTSSVYSSIDSNSQNVGYSTYFQNSTGGFLPTGTSVSILGTFAGVPNSISIPSGVWIISASFTPYVSSTTTSNTASIQLKVSNTTTAGELSGFPASNLHNLYNVSYGTGAQTRMVNTFVYTTSSSQTLYLWGSVIYVFGTWLYSRAELRATRIA